jgi:hypothetical protein
MTWTLKGCAPAILAVLALAPGAASAQEAAAVQPVAVQPAKLVVQQVQDGWLAAPDVKFARIDGRDAALVGGYGGWVHDRAVLVGGGAYWLANGRDGVEMAYGGLVLEWLTRTDRRIGFGARTLVGGGEATIPISSGRVFPPDPAAIREDIRFGHKPHGGNTLPGGIYPAKVRWNDTFFIAEPQVNALLNVTGWCRINVGVGYRVVAGAPLIEDRLRGVSGTVAVQFGGGK